MPIESFELETVIAAPPEKVYAAWIDPKLHAAFTGSPATVEPWVGGRFTAHDGYIHGINLELSPARRIVQTWRSSEFPLGSPDSRLAVELSPAEGGGTLIKLLHSNIPNGQSKTYRTGWATFYFKPLARFFEPKVPASKAQKAAKAAAAAATAAAAGKAEAVKAAPPKAAAAPKAARSKAPAPKSAAPRKTALAPAKRVLAKSAKKAAAKSAKKPPARKASPTKAAPSRKPAAKSKAAAKKATKGKASRRK